MAKSGFFVVLLLWQAWSAFAGGSGLNLVVVANQNSSNSLQLANEYCERRGVPPQNLFRMTNWTGGSIAWSRTDFENSLRQPLLAALASRGLTNQVSYVLLSMDIPYRVEEAGSANSTTAVLFYGFKTNTPFRPDLPATCSLPDYSSNSFAFSEAPFEEAKPNTADTNSFLSFMLTDNTLAGAQAILTRGLAADNSFPTQTVYLEKTSDPARNVRFFSFDNALFDSRISGGPSLLQLYSDSTSFDNIRGLLTGLAVLTLPSDAFVPGSLGDSLTSYAGALFDGFAQTTLLAFLDAGAAASYGTVIEPCNYLQKFPDPMAYIYQTRGFNAAEAYYQSLANPYQGVLVGEPLCAPFAAPGQASWPGLTNGSILQGEAALPAAIFTAAKNNLPIAQVDLFIDGLYARTLTNVVPPSGSMLSVTLNGAVVPDTVSTNTTLGSITRRLAESLNAQSNSTKVVAVSFGDRIELQCTDPSLAGSNVLLSAGSSAGYPGTLNPARSNFLDTSATGYLGLSVTNPMSPGDWLSLLVTKTNGLQVSLGATNSASTNVADLCQLLMNQVNASADLQGPDGVLADNLYPDINFGQFFLWARSPGWAAAKIQAVLSASSNLLITPVGSHTFEDNISDLRPRNELNLSRGFGELSIAFSLDTTRLADGFHELTLVGYEGTSVRTQTRVSRTFQVRNGSLSANLIPSTASTNITLDTPVTMAVVTSSTNISNIELFSTGGSLGIISNQATAGFSIPSAFLGIGLHPFYAVVTDAVGNQFRTQTLTMQIIPSFALSISSSPLTLSWPAIPGLTYSVLGSTNLAAGFQPIAQVTPSGPIGQWVVPQTANQSFYRIELGP